MMEMVYMFFISVGVVAIIGIAALVVAYVQHVEDVKRVEEWRRKNPFIIAGKELDE